MTDKLYIGRHPEGDVYVVEVSDCDVKPLSGAPLAHRLLHSPTGFAWGYAGSGPSDLARSILWDFMGHEPSAYLYQDFKWQFIVPLADNFMLDGREIARWLEERAEAELGREDGDD